MNKLASFVLTTFVTGAVLFPVVVQAADAPSSKGKWGFGVRGGVSVYTSNDIDDGDTAPMVSGIVTYGVTDWFTLGFNAEWEEHDIPGGDLQTVSLLPTVEFRTTFGALAPYLLVGYGVNLNSFERDSSVKALGVNLDPDTTVAVKLGGGTDYFFTRAFAFNTELGWKFNDADSDVKVGGTKVDSVGTDASAFSALFGFRYYF